MKMALGKGLGALIPEKERTAGLLELDINTISPNEHQPRRVFNNNSLNELASSIKEKGVIQPVIVRKTGDNSYILIAGERRWRAARNAGLSKIPAIVRDSRMESASGIPHPAWNANRAHETARRRIGASHPTGCFRVSRRVVRLRAPGCQGSPRSLESDL